MFRKLFLSAAVSAAVAGPVAAGDFSDAFFATPLPPGPGTFLPPSGPLAAPAITPLGIGKHGSRLYEMVPAGPSREAFLTSHPGHYVNNACASPACSTERVGWLSAEFLYWATQGPSAPPLVTSGPALLGPGVSAAFGIPTTTQLLGTGQVLNGLRPGFRVTGGFYLDNAGNWALSQQFFSLGSRSESLAGGSNGANVVNLPQSLGGVQFPLYVGFPGLTLGTTAASMQTNFLGGDAALRRVLRTGDTFRLDLLGGYRFLHLGDSISESFDIVSTGVPGIPPGSRLMGEDSVRTRNNFHGGEVGFTATGRYGRFTIEVQSTVALGITDSELDTSRTRSLFGPAALLPPIPGVPLPGGIPLAVGSSNQTDYFAVAPEVGVKFGWQPTSHLRLTTGYNFLYWSRVRRAQEDYVPGAAVLNNTTDFWAQGFTVGAELRY